MWLCTSITPWAIAVVAVIKLKTNNLIFFMIAKVQCISHSGLTLFTDTFTYITENLKAHSFVGSLYRSGLSAITLCPLLQLFL